MSKKLNSCISPVVLDARSTGETQVKCYLKYRHGNVACQAMLPATCNPSVNGGMGSPSPHFRLLIFCFGKLEYQPLSRSAETVCEVAKAQPQEVTRERKRFSHTGMPETEDREDHLTSERRNSSKVPNCCQGLDWFSSYGSG